VRRINFGISFPSGKATDSIVLGLIVQGTCHMIVACQIFAQEKLEIHIFDMLYVGGFETRISIFTVHSFF